VFDLINTKYLTGINEETVMSQTENFFRKYSDMVLEAEQTVVEGEALDRVSARATSGGRQMRAPTRMPTAADSNGGAYKSDAAVTKADPNRVQVAPNVQKKVLDYEKNKQKVDDANKSIRQFDSPTATNIGTKIGGALGDVVAGSRAAWDSGVDAFKGKVAPIPDPVKPVDIIPDPKRGSTTPKESAGEIMRKLSDIAEGKDPSNVKQKSAELMKPYKAKKSEE
jgi:hypothetical protein